MLRRAVPVVRSVVPAVLSVAGAVLLVAGCGADAPPEVTFAAGEATVLAAPTQYCEDDFVTCRNDAAAPVDLVVPPGTALVVSVPPTVSDTPWQIVFTYRDGAGEQVDERTRVFAPQQQQSFALTLPGPDDRLLGAQVQQYGPPPEIDPETGDVVFPIRSSWVLRAAAA